MTRHNPTPPPPRWGKMSFGSSEGVSDEEKAGRPVAPPIELTPAGPPPVLSEGVSDEEKAGRPVAPPIELHPTAGPAVGDPSRAEDAEHLSRALAGLKGDERRVFEYVYVYGVSYTAVASMLCLPEDEVVRLSHLAAGRFRRLLAADHSETNGATPPASD